jgi:hypothetical protein
MIATSSGSRWPGGGDEDADEDDADDDDMAGRVAAASDPR